MNARLLSRRPQRRTAPPIQRSALLFRDLSRVAIAPPCPRPGRVQPLWRLHNHTGSAEARRLAHKANFENNEPRGDSWALRCSDVSNRGLAATAIHLRIERYPLAFYEARPTGSFQRARMHEDVFPTVIRLNEAITFLHAVKFHFACTSSTVFG